MHGYILFKKHLAQSTFDPDLNLGQKKFEKKIFNFLIHSFDLNLMNVLEAK